MTSSKKNESVQKKSDFSIEHILTKAGNKNSDILEFRNLQHDELMGFSWLNCTRYCPPKLPRSQKKEGPQKRQLGRHPRIPFSSQQLAVLEEKFKQSPYLSSAEVTQISRTLQLADIRVKIWFQNRRARERRERNEQEIQLKPSCSMINEVKVNQMSNEIFTTPIIQSPTTTTTTTTTTTKTTSHQRNTYLQNMNILPMPVTHLSMQNYSTNVSCFMPS